VVKGSILREGVQSRACIQDSKHRYWINEKSLGGVVDVACEAVFCKDPAMLRACDFVKLCRQALRGGQKQKLHRVPRTTCGVEGNRSVLNTIAIE
jgi:hypothetical protein